MTSPAPSDDPSSPNGIPPTEDEWRTEETRSGDLTAWRSGRILHSRFDPRKEAVRAARSVRPGAAVVVLGGLGLGYVAEALLEESEDRRLVIAEADPELPALAGRARDLTALLGNKRVSLLAGGRPGDAAEFLRGGPVGAEVAYLEWKPSAALHPDWYAELGSVVDETRRRREVNARTLERFGPLWVRNLAANARMMARAVSLAPWKDAFRDIPALVLAGGPSLEDLLPVLPRLAENHLLIAVDTAVPAVLRSGARPDIVAAVDPQYWNTRHLDRCAAGVGDALVLAEAATHPAVFRTLAGRPWLTRTRFPLGTLLEDAAGIVGELRAGGSVATAAWDLARHLGCSPMSVAGLDLGFPGGRTHYSGSLARQRPLMYSCRIAPAEGTFYHALRDAGAHPVPSAGGGRVLSDARMDVYAAWFAESAAGMPDRSPMLVGGAGRAIDGMDVGSVDELLDRPAMRPRIDGILEAIRTESTADRAEDRIFHAVDQILSALNALEEAALRGVGLVREAVEAIREGRDAAAPLFEMEHLDRDILAGEGLELVSFLLQPIILEISSQSDSDRIDPLETSRRLYREIAESAAYHRKYLVRIH